MSLYGTPNSAVPDPPSNDWTKLVVHTGSSTYDPVAVMILPQVTKVRHLAFLTDNNEKIINMKEVQVFGCLRKYTNAILYPYILKLKMFHIVDFKVILVAYVASTIVQC